MSSFWLNSLIDLLLVIFVADCLFMGLAIMMQRSKQEGLGTTFGGSGMQDLFGAQTSSVLVKATVFAAALFFILSISLARLYSMRESSAVPASSVQQELEKSAVATPVTPAPAKAAPVTTPAPAAPSATSTKAPGAPAPVPTPAPNAPGIPTH